MFMIHISCSLQPAEHNYSADLNDSVNHYTFSYLVIVTFFATPNVV